MEWKDYIKTEFSIWGDGFLGNSNMFFFPQNITKLNTNIWVEQVPDNRNKYGFPPYIKFQYNNSKNKSKFYIPISIEDNPKILVENYKLKISNGDLKNIVNFIKKYKNELLDIDNQDLECDELKDILLGKTTIKEIYDWKINNW